jgi:hypothetical protein
MPHTPARVRPLRSSLTVGAVVLATTQLGGFCAPAGPGPCDSDRFNCDDGASLGFVVRDDCTEPATPLSIALGTGYGAFTAFDGSGEPPIERGSQGGQHAVLSYRVGGADLAQSDRLRVSFALSHNNTGGCDGDAGSDVWMDDAGDTSGGREVCEQDIGTRKMIRGGSKYPLKAAADGIITETGIIVVLDWWGPVSFPFRVRATVEDLCGRRAEVVQDFDPMGVGW